MYLKSFYDASKFMSKNNKSVPNISNVFLLVITGTVIATVTRAGSLHATISIINVYKEGNLAIQQAGKNMSAKILVMCKQCPLIRRGKYTVITALCVYKR